VGWEIGREFGSRGIGERPPMVTSEPGLSVAQLVAVAVQLARELERVHESGRIHGAVFNAGISREVPPRAQLSEPPEGELILDDPEPVSERSPPELSSRGLQLPRDREAARRAIELAGISLDPRRIDVFQAGVLLVKLASSESLSTYLRSPRARGQVPRPLRDVIDAALGYDAKNRLHTPAELIAAARRALRDSERSNPKGDTTPSFAGPAGPQDTDIEPGRPQRGLNEQPLPVNNRNELFARDMKFVLQSG
jgi:hypothetical protein